MTPSRGAVVKSLLSLLTIIALLTSLLNGYTNILFLISGDRTMNSMPLIQPWAVKVITCKGIKTNSIDTYLFTVIRNTMSNNLSCFDATCIMSEYNNNKFIRQTG